MGKSGLPLALSLQPFAGRTVIVGVSGGADSVGLLRALLLAGAKPVAAHLDHALRPEAAEDAEWVRQLAAGLNVPFETVRVDVNVLAQQRGWNQEDAARRVRYDFLGRIAKKHHAEVILTAHTRRDQAETVLMQLLRGEAVLNGIPAGHRRVQRPWLDVPRQEIEAFLQGLGQSWREDPTNTDPSYTRAWLRTQVMPLLLARYPGLETALARLAHYSAQDDAALNQLAATLNPHTPLPHQSPAVLRRWVKQELEHAGLNFHTKHLEELTEALQQSRTTHQSLPQNQAVTVTGGRLYLEPLKWPAPTFAIPDGWTPRTRQDGDRIHLNGGTRKLSDILTDAHIPRAERDKVPLLVSKEGVQWIGLTPPIWAVGAREHANHPEDPLHLAMAEALKLARQAAAELEVPVGAVVLDASGQIVGRGHNTSRADGDMTRHAELTAIREAVQTLATPYLTSCTLVVTLEPCPMCLGAALEARIGHIVFGASNPKAGALGGVADLLAAPWGHRPKITGGIRAKEAGKLLKDTFKILRVTSESQH